MCPHTAIHACPHTAMYVASYCYMCVLIFIYVCPHPAIFASILLCMRTHTAVYVSSYCYMCVLILLCKCPDSAIRVSSYDSAISVSSYCWVCYICVRMRRWLPVGRHHPSLETLSYICVLILLCLLCMYSHAQVASCRAATPESRNPHSYATSCANCPRSRLVRLVGRRS